MLIIIIIIIIIKGIINMLVVPRIIGVHMHYVIKHLQQVNLLPNIIKRFLSCDGLSVST